jgi:hypothetical protein
MREFTSIVIPGRASLRKSPSPASGGGSGRGHLPHARLLNLKKILEASKPLQRQRAPSPTLPRKREREAPLIRPVFSLRRTRA